MKKIFQKIKFVSKNTKLDPNKPAQRKQIIVQAVQRTANEYGETLKRLGAE
jgi:hypothetical protein